MQLLLIASTLSATYETVGFVNQVTVPPVYNDDDELEQFMALLNQVDDM